VVSRRPEHGTISWEQALADPAVALALVCTENVRHEKLVRAALEAGKHVLVEYPMCLGAGRAQALFDLADRAGRILHEASSQ
jgi:biliverdin reductase